MSTNKTAKDIADHIVAAIKVSPEDKRGEYIRLMLKEVISNGSDKAVFDEILAGLAKDGIETDATFEAISKEVQDEVADIESVLTEENSGMVTARNGFIAGTVIGAGAGVLNRGVSITTLSTTAVASVGSYFLGNQLDKHIPEKVQNKYAKAAGGTLLGLAFGAGSVIGVDIAKNVITERFFNNEDSAADAAALF